MSGDVDRQSTSLTYQNAQISKTNDRGTTNERRPYTYPTSIKHYPQVTENKGT